MEVKKEKVVVTLLLITIILSISSVIVTMNLNLDDIQESSDTDVSLGNLNGNVQLIVEEPPVGITGTE
jgi:hypothetical protein